MSLDKDAISFEDFIMDVGQNHSRTTALSMEIFYLVRNVFFLCLDRFYIRQSITVVNVYRK